MVHHRKSKRRTILAKKRCQVKRVSQHAERITFFKSSSLESGLKATYSQQNNPTLEQALTISAPTIDAKLFKDFRHYIFEPIKVNHPVGLQAIAEQAKSNIDYRTIRYSQLAKREILQILYEKLLKHKWGDATVILESYGYVGWRRLIPESCGDEYFKWRWQPFLYNNVGREILYNHPLAINDSNLHKMLNRSLTFFGIALDTANIAIENGFYHLAKLDFDAAEECFSNYDYIGRSEHNKEKRRQMALEKKDLVDAYSGIIKYCRWQNALRLEGSNELLAGATSSEPSPVVEIANAMTKIFEGLWSSDGVWDVAMTKNFEVLEYSYQLASLKNDLSLYSQHHKNNPNAHRYLSIFLKEHPIVEEECSMKLRLSALKRLRKVSPSDPTLIDLHLLYQQLNKKVAVENKVSEKKLRRKYFKSFSVIMDLLDHPCSLDLSSSWCELHAQLTETRDLLSKSCFSKLIKDLWVKSGRHTWWPRFHFCSGQAFKIASHADQALIKAKLFAASTFMGPNCQFCSIVEQSIQS